MHAPASAGRATPTPCQTWTTSLRRCARIIASSGSRRGVSEPSQTIFPLQHPLHRFETDGVEDRFPPICPVMPHQGLRHAGPPNPVLAFRIRIEILDDRVDIA